MTTMTMMIGEQCGEAPMTPMTAMMTTMKVRRTKTKERRHPQEARKDSLQTAAAQQQQHKGKGAAGAALGSERNLPSQIITAKGTVMRLRASRRGRGEAEDVSSRQRRHQQRATNNT